MEFLFIWHVNSDKNAFSMYRVELDQHIVWSDFKIFSINIKEQKCFQHNFYMELLRKIPI